MSIFEAIILGIIQGLTEFIPVSSSGHLLLAHSAFGVSDNGLAFDVALHMGTFAALLIYFKSDIYALILGLLGKNKMKRLAWIMAIATIPAVIGGILLQGLAESSFRSPFLVGINLIWVAIAMIAAENYSEKRNKKTNLHTVSRKQGLVVGCAQALALVPGISRSGSTITAGIFAGLDRVSATRFSFLLAIPITFGAILKVVFSPETLQSISNDKAVFVAGIGAAFISGLWAIQFLIKYLSKHSLRIFAYYRIAVGIMVMLVLAR